jgi:hypothetical protein
MDIGLVEEVGSNFKIYNPEKWDKWIIFRNLTRKWFKAIVN